MGALDYHKHMLVAKVQATSKWLWSERFIWMSFDLCNWCDLQTLGKLRLYIFLCSLLCSAHDVADTPHANWAVLYVVQFWRSRGACSTEKIWFLYCIWPRSCSGVLWSCRWPHQKPILMLQVCIQSFFMISRLAVRPLLISVIQRSTQCAWGLK